MNIKEEIKNKVIELLESGTSEGVKKAWETRRSGAMKRSYSDEERKAWVAVQRKRKGAIGTKTQKGGLIRLSKKSVISKRTQKGGLIRLFRKKVASMKTRKGGLIRLFNKGD